MVALACRHGNPVFMLNKEKGTNITRSEIFALYCERSRRVVLSIFNFVDL